MRVNLASCTDVTGGKLRVQGFFLCRGDPKPVVGLNIDDVAGVVAAQLAAGWMPRCVVARAFLGIETAVDRAEVARVIGEVTAGLHIPLLCTFLPGIRQSDNVVNLYLRRCGLPAHKINGLTAIGIMESAG